MSLVMLVRPDGTTDMLTLVGGPLPAEHVPTIVLVQVALSTATMPLAVGTYIVVGVFIGAPVASAGSWQVTIVVPESQASPSNCESTAIQSMHPPSFSSAGPHGFWVKVRDQSGPGGIHPHNR